MLVTAAFPACDNGLLTIRGHYFEETDFPIGVSLELTELTVLDSDETFILAELPATFCDRPGSYLLTVTREPRVAPRGKTAKSKSKKGSRRRATAKLTPLDVGMFDVSIGDDGGATDHLGPPAPMTRTESTGPRDLGARTGGMATTERPGRTRSTERPPSPPV